MPDSVLIILPLTLTPLGEGTTVISFYKWGNQGSAHAGKIPDTGEIFHEGKFTFEIVDMDGNHIDKILVTINEEDANKLDLESKED